jgi:hypothetical protein
MKTYTSDGARPVMTSASTPSRFSSSAKWLDERESPMKPVSGDFVTTANFAVVVRPVPTSGALVKMSGLSGEKGSTPAGA